MFHINAVLSSEKVQVISWNRVLEATMQDPVLVKLSEMIYREFPQNTYELGEDLKPFFKFRHDLHVMGGVVCYKDRVIIPEKL